MQLIRSSSYSPPCPCPSTSSSLSNPREDLPCLLLPLVVVEACKCHQPCQGSLVELTFAIKQDICLAGADPYRLIHLSLQTTSKAPQRSHCEFNLFSTMFQSAVFPEGVVFLLIPEAILVFQPSGTPMSDIFFQGPHDITRYFGFLYDIRYYHTIFAICPILSKMRVNCRKCNISVKFVKSTYNTHKIIL